MEKTTKLKDNSVDYAKIFGIFFAVLVLILFLIVIAVIIRCLIYSRLENK